MSFLLFFLYFPSLQPASPIPQGPIPDDVNRIPPRLVLSKTTHYDTHLSAAQKKTTPFRSHPSKLFCLVVDSDPKVQQHKVRPLLCVLRAGLNCDCDVVVVVVVVVVMARTGDRQWVVARRRQRGQVPRSHPSQSN